MHNQGAGALFFGCQSSRHSGWTRHLSTNSMSQVSYTDFGVQTIPSISEYAVLTYICILTCSTSDMHKYTPILA